MLDKLKFNNLIISNAKVIQKVRIQIVRRIIQKMRKLTSLIEKQPGNQSTIVKQRKCVAIVEQVRKIKREDVIRNILLLEKNPSKIVTNSQSTPEEVAIAMFAVNKTMQALVERFRKELNYNDEEAENWQKTLIEIGKLKAKKQRRKKRAEKKEKQINKTLKKDKPNEKPKKNKKCNEEKLEEPTLSSDEDINEKPKSTKSKPIIPKDNIDNVELKSSDNDEVIEKTNIEKPMVVTNGHDDMQNKAKKVKTAKVKSEKFNAETQIKFLSGYGKFKDLQEKIEKTPKYDAEEPAVKVGVVDPFFITETGEPYVANIVLKPEQIENDDESTAKSQENFARKPRTEGADNRRSRRKSQAESVEDKNLHPSWLAKKKQSTIADFRGKKIKFDESTPTEGAQVFPHSNKVAINSDLHPSWAAKQKLKPTITAFQGKKITFGDDQ